MDERRLSWEATDDFAVYQKELKLGKDQAKQAHDASKTSTTPFCVELLQRLTTDLGVVAARFSWCEKCVSRDRAVKDAAKRFSPNGGKKNEKKKNRYNTRERNI